MKIKYRIPIVGDRAGERTSSFLFRSNRTYAPFRGRHNNMNQFGEFVIRVGNVRGTIHSGSADPLLANMAKSVDAWFLKKPSWKAPPDSDNDWLSQFTWKYKDGNVSILLTRNNGIFKMNGVKKNKKDVASTLSKVILFGIDNRSAIKMGNYIEKNINLPENILYALENRTPYHFYKEGRKVSARLNVELVGSKEVAFEVSDGIWGSTSIKDANTFINSYRFGHARSKKWSNINPRRLWFNLFNREPSDSEVYLMIEWMEQNRTEVMVDKRATQLLKDLSDKYDRLHLVDFNEPMTTTGGMVKHTQYSNTELSDYIKNIKNQVDRDGSKSKARYALFVQGKKFDWLVHANNSASKYQQASAILITDTKIEGPFCIDNIHDNSSIGDQIASRAMIVMNDDKASKMVGTLRRIEDISPANNRDKIRRWFTLRSE